jgi:hypothetical protein
LGFTTSSDRSGVGVEITNVADRACSSMLVAPTGASSKAASFTSRNTFAARRTGRRRENRELACV